jgi:methylated-DNA-[protein]-cysteine S-methyltransferase
VRATQHRYTVDGWGVGEVWVRGGVLIHHELAGTLPDSVDLAPDMTAQDEGAVVAAFPPNGGATSPTGTLALNVSRKANDFVSELCRLFVRHLAGAPTAYRDVRIDDSWCTPFQLELLRALRAVPWGEVVSYGELAVLADRPGAARAAGTFCAENRFSLIVPCHRVVAADGIGGYGTSGVALKRRLLALEGVEL